ncbi:unnamed protein product, partial [Iphiclides podalirius]
MIAMSIWTALVAAGLIGLGPLACEKVMRCCLQAGVCKKKHSPDLYCDDMHERDDGCDGGQPHTNRAAALRQIPQVRLFQEKVK